MNYLVIDQGTSSTKAFLFNARGQILHQNRIKCSVEKPKPFHVEIDPLIILEDIKELFEDMVNVSGYFSSSSGPSIRSLTPRSNAAGL